MYFPMLQGFLNKKNKQGQQFPEQMPVQPSYPGQPVAPRSREEYNEQQADVNRGMIGGKLNRRKF